MKFKSILMVFFLLMGSIYIQAQPPHVLTSDQTVKPADVKPDPGRDCTSLEGITQVCEDDGTVTLSFYISNNSAYFVHYIRITGPNGWFQNIPTNLPSNTVSSVQVTYPGAVQGSTVCFDVKLYNPLIGVCCYEEICIKVDDCPCGTITDEKIDCLPTPGTYEYCFTVNNPAYSSNTIDQLTLFSFTNGVCLNGSALPTTISIPAIAPGNTGVVCVVFSGCDPANPLSDGDVFDFIAYLEDTSDPAYCCHIPTKDLTMSDCCDDFSATTTSTDTDCDIQNGTITFTMTGGTAPYSTTYQTGTTGATINNINTNPYTANFVAAGNYTYVVTDANGCETTGNVTVLEVLCPCDLSFDPSGGEDGLDTTIISNGTGFLCFDFHTLSVPDQLIVLVNGVQVVNSGIFSTNNWTTPCGGNTIVFGNNQHFLDQIQVNQGDVVQIIVIGDNCNTIYTTVWELDVTCQSTPCAGPQPVPVPTSHQLELIRQEEGIQQSDSNVKNRVGQTTTSSSLKVFPNPVQDVLIIQNTDTEVSYETVNILDSTGKIIRVENMSGNSDTRVDVSSLPRGIYFIDAMDSTGNKVTERFVKVN